MLYLRSFNRFILISLALLGLSVSSVSAALVTYTDRASFLAATDNVSVIDFGGIAGPGSSVTYGASGLTLSGVNFVANDGSAPLGFFVLDDTFCCNAYSGRGDNVASLSGEVRARIDITLPGGFTAVGMDLFSVLRGNNAGTAVSTMSIDIAGGTSQIGTVQAVSGGTNDQGRVFIGFISDIPLNMLTVYPPNNLNIAADIVNFTFGTAANQSAVPVPAAIWLFGTALIGLVGFGKRKIAA